MKKTLLIVLVCMVATLPTMPFAADDIRSVDFQNFTYFPVYCVRAFAKDGIRKTVKVRKGEWSERDAYYSVSDVVLYSDLDDDGKEEAIVQTYCSPIGANYSLSEVFIFRMKGEIPVVIARLDEAQLQKAYEQQHAGGMLWRMGEPELLSDKRTIVFRAPADGAHATPANEIVFTYRLAGGKLIAVQKPQMRPFKG